MFRYENVTGGVTPANNLWKYIGGVSPDDIELNSATGVTGINAVNPVDPKIFLFLKSLFGSTAGAFVFIDGNRLGNAGVIGNGGNYVANLAMTDTVTGELASFNVEDTYRINSGISGAVGDPDEYRLEITKSDKIEKVLDVALNDSVEETRMFNLQEFVVKIAGVVVARWMADQTETRFERLTANGAMYLTQTEDGGGAGKDLVQMLLQPLSNSDNISVSVFEDYSFLQYADDPLGANNRMQIKARIDRASIEFNDTEVFAIKSDGKIETNQTQAPALHTVKVADLPIYDAAGVLVGYIPVMT